ncbi:type IV pilin protein [Curvibacter lanceolatus]|uniref:type IV pilin protein n=1 Tax=Curvibacter lanceolatus TaxID=86182 RepID=UPI0004CE564B|nr:type IV pilin protein [Curvibacter lanceolatus]
MPHRNTHRSMIAGFTLIELMIAVAIVGILTAVALPAYQKQILKSRRTDAKTALLDLASREERYMSTNQAYASNGTLLGFSSDFPVSVPSGSAATYTLSVTLSNSNGSYTLTATPTGNQTQDTCGSYTLTSLGVQGISGGSMSAADCWK